MENPTARADRPRRFIDAPGDAGRRRWPALLVATAMTLVACVGQGSSPPSDDAGAAGHDHAAEATGGGDSEEAAPPTGPASRILTSDDSAELAEGFTVPAGEIWELDPDRDVELVVSGNVVVEGVLRMRPATADITHLLRFTGVDETAFVGGGHEVLDTDTGVWVMEDGRLDLQGTERTGWTTLEGGAAAGATELTLATEPVGWAEGDELAVAPTVAPGVDDHYDQFDEVTIAAIDGRRITLDTGLGHDHPAVDDRWTAEVMNLTRNVRIEGTAVDDPSQPSSDGRAHVFVHSGAPQSIRHVLLRHLGPRTGSGDEIRGVTGRYSLHFHHSGDGSRGSVVEGVVVRDSGNSAYVPHASHGIVLRDDIAYDGYESAVWWDPPGGLEGREPRESDLSQDTDDLLIERVIVARLHAYPEFRGYALAGFTMATGTDMTIRDSVAVGVGGNASASGYTWPEANNQHPNNVWTFTDNVAHNNRADGIFTWQNDANRHVVDGFTAYHNGEQGIEHGAYRNDYTYRNLNLFGNGAEAIIQHPASGGDPTGESPYSLSFEQVATDGPLTLEIQRLGSDRPALYRDCAFTEVVVSNASEDDNPGFYDFVDCGLTPDDFRLEDVEPGTTIRIQNGDEAIVIDDSGVATAIEPFLVP